MCAFMVDHTVRIAFFFLSRHTSRSALDFATQGHACVQESRATLVNTQDIEAQSFRPIKKEVPGVQKGPEPKLRAAHSIFLYYCHLSAVIRLTGKCAR